MGGFSQGFTTGANLAAQQTAYNEQLKAQQRDAQAKLYETALNNPAVSPDQRQQLLQGYTSLFAPHEAPTLIERLSGLIHGAAKQTGKAHQGIADALTGPSAPPAMAAPPATPSGAATPSPVAPANGGAPTNPPPAPGSTAAATSTPVQGFGIGAAPAEAPISGTAGSSTSPTSLPPAAHALATGVPGELVPTPQETMAAGEPPMHPFQSAHPFLDRLNAGIHEIGQHLQGFAQPNGPPPGPPAGIGQLLASSYESPETVKLRELKAANIGAMNLQKAKQQATLAAIDYRAMAGNPKAIAINKAIHEYMQKNDLDDVSQVPSTVWDEANRKFNEKLTKTVMQDANSSTGWSTVEELPETGHIESVLPGAVPPRGTVPTKRVTSTTDALGNVTYTTSSLTPQLAGGKAPQALGPGEGQQAPAPAGAPISSAAPATPASLSTLQSTVNGKRTSAAPPAAPSATRAAAPRSSRAPGGPSAAPASPDVDPVTRQAYPALDASGHIPSNYGNALVTEAANRLLDGYDVKSIRGKNMQERAGMLARHFGWAQGMLTPLQMLPVNEATTFLKAAADDKSMSVLDDAGSRGKLQQLIGKAPEGVDDIKKLLAVNVAASNLNPQEQAFLRMYQRLAGVIQGMSVLTRSGKMTEAGVDRLVTELPNPYMSTTSADGRQRILNLLQEINLVKQGSVSAQNAQGGGGGGGPMSSNAPGAPVDPDLVNKLNQSLGKGTKK